MIADRPTVPLLVRIAAFWLAACSMSVGISFVQRLYLYWPDVFVASWVASTIDWMASTIGLALSAGVGATLALKRVFRSRTGTIIILLGAHLVAFASAHAFFTSRVHCFSMTTWVEYTLPDQTGALILYGPSLVVILASLMIRRAVESF